jgi:predicted small metal-binding protein
MKLLACRNAGFDCGTIIRGDTEDGIMVDVADHAMKEHNMKPKDITPQFREN